MRRPSAPVEKSPLIGLTPECRPDTDWHEHAVVDAGEQLAGRRRPGREGQGPACRRCGVDEKPRTAEPVEAVPHAAGRVAVVQEALRARRRRSAGVRRVARPSPSTAVAVMAAGFGGVVDEGHERRRHLLADPVGEQRAALQHVLGADRAKPRMPRNWAVTNGSSTTVARGDGGFVAPSMRVARAGDLGGAGLDVELAGLAPDREPEAGLGLVAVGRRGRRRRGRRRSRWLVGADAGGGDDRRPRRCRPRSRTPRRR